MTDTIDIEFEVRLQISNAIDRQSLVEDFGNDLLHYTKWLCKEEGLWGVIDDDYTILRASEVNR